jgi:hypothetical protein
VAEGSVRGNAVDRFYLERFLKQHQHLITGRVLEVQVSSNTKRFGHDVLEARSVDINPALSPANLCDSRRIGSGDSKRILRLLSSAEHRLVPRPS